MTPYKEYADDLEFCRKIQKKYGKSFYAGTLFLLPEERDATFVLYAFFRLPDEYIDTLYADSKDIALTKLNEWNEAWKMCFEGKGFMMPEDETRVLRATKYVFDTYGIPFVYSQSFIEAMIQDTWKERYETYADLEKYMYGSAVVVGLMMTYIVCKNDSKFKASEEYRNNILSKARSLGEAFQMTNFLRDIGEDYDSRGRIYIPTEHLKRFDVSEEDIKTKRVTDNFISLMKFEFERIEILYNDADIGIGLLPRRAGRGIYVARQLYSKILEEIKRNGYDSLGRRAHLSKFEKIYQSIRALMVFKNKYE